MISYEFMHKARKVVGFSTISIQMGTTALLLKIKHAEAEIQNMCPLKAHTISCNLTALNLWSPSLSLSVGLRQRQTRGRQGDRLREGQRHLHLQLPPNQELQQLQSVSGAAGKVSFTYVMSISEKSSAVISAVCAVVLTTTKSKT